MNLSNTFGGTELTSRCQPPNLIAHRIEAKPETWWAIASATAISSMSNFGAKVGDDCFEWMVQFDQLWF